MTRRLWLLALLALTLSCAPIFLLPVVFDDQFPRLETFADTQLISQSLAPQFSLRFCRLSLIQTQRLETRAERDLIWQRLPAQWEDSNDAYLSYHDQMRYGRSYTRFVEVGSWLHYESSAPDLKPVHVRNHITLRFCG